MDIFHTMKHLFKTGNEKEDDRKQKEWQRKVVGMIPILVDDMKFENNEAFEFHMLISWSDEIKLWCLTNCTAKYIFGHFNYLGPYVYFDSEEDAMAFKLRWA